MKILEATAIIGLLREIRSDNLIDKILKLNHELIIPSHVYSEILDDISRKSCDKLIDSGKIRKSTLNTEKEINDFQKTYPYLGRGEADSILHYEKLSKGKISVYCILDDGKARKIAKKHGINFTGLIGLLKLMRKRDILSEKELKTILGKLRKSNFRFPKELVK